MKLKDQNFDYRFWVTILAIVTFVNLFGIFKKELTFNETLIWALIETVLVIIILAKLALIFQQRIEKRVRNLVSKVRDAEVVARQNVAVYLHSEVQPRLLEIEREIADLGSSKSQSIAERLNKVTREFVRTASHSLYPPELLVSIEFALETLIANRAELVIDYRLMSSDSKSFNNNSKHANQNRNKTEIRIDLGPALSWAIYSVARELVANSEQKNDANQITVSVMVGQKSVTVKVLDDGRPLPKILTKGFGHRIVEKIMNDFGGSFKIESLDKGVEATCNFPYEPELIKE